MKRSIGFEVSLNGAKIARAGIDNKNYVITCILGAVYRNDGSNELYLSVGGMDSVEKVYLDWQGADLKKGDKIIVEVIDDDFDKPLNIRSNESLEKQSIEDKLKYFHRLKEELKDYL